ncbi:hypothetical protein CW749_25125 [Vibrio sp. vnigr-6D03]|uniref:ATP-binding protein n=1 Tax=Vibrio sp. vnigr-6D03 TaxID=2058088 RepID=UPI000C31D885|nr:ATP-binding protein [Vibrio sp. vnigr-6D03]PKF76835.1 hypothetical protein CW749_25125 [Vibrio sp. vnigr-6D03]
MTFKTKLFVFTPLLVALTIVLSIVASNVLMRSEINRQNEARLHNATSSLQRRISDDFPHIHRQYEAFRNSGSTQFLMGVERGSIFTAEDFIGVLTFYPDVREYLLEFSRLYDISSYAIYLPADPNSSSPVFDESVNYLYAQFNGELDGIIINETTLIRWDSRNFLRKKDIEPILNFPKKFVGSPRTELTTLSDGTIGISYSFELDNGGVLVLQRSWDFDLAIQEVDLGVEISLYDESRNRIDGSSLFTKLEDDIRIGTGKKQLDLKDIDGQIHTGLASTIKDKGVVLGYLVTSISQQVIEDATKRVAVLLIVSGLVLVLLAAAIAILMARSFIEPISQLIKDFSAIANGNINHKINITRRDEFGELARNFYFMQSAIKDNITELNLKIQERDVAERKVRKLNEELEDRVMLRTEELRHAVNEMEKAKEGAEKANRAKSEFLANMSHEIRTPMNAILGFSEILHSEEANPKKLNFINKIRTSGKALLHLINDVLDLSKVEAGKLEFHMAPTSVPKMFEELHDMFDHKATSSNLALIYEIEKGMPESLLMDENRLRQVFINLIGNAVKFTTQGYVKVTARAIPVEDDFRLEFEIEDTGIGIKKDQIDKIFGSFEQAEATESRFGGTGLGLAISKQIIELLGGQISVSSEFGAGTTFGVTLPLVKPAKAIEGEDAPVDDNLIVSFEPAKILIADDVDYNQEILAQFLTGFPFTIDYADDGIQMLERVEKSTPDLILMDIKMPNMDGREASEILKNDPRYQDIPIIAVTASALSESLESHIKHCEGCITKPVDRDSLIEELKRFLAYTNVSRVMNGAVALQSQSIEVEGEIRVPSGEVLSNIRTLAIDGFIDDIQEMVQPLSTDFPEFTERVVKFAHEFDDQKIIDMVDDYINERP